MHIDKRWKKIIKEVAANKKKEEAHYDKHLVAKLDKIYEDDQSHRLRLHEIEEKYGWKSSQMDSIWKVIGAVSYTHLDVYKRQGARSV